MKRTSTLPYFQLDSGRMLASCMGLSMEERGLYLSLMLLYWEGECRLPTREALCKKLGIKGKKAEALLDAVLAEFFPEGVHEHLDTCRENALQTSRNNAANAKKGHEKRRALGGIPETTGGLSSSDIDF